MQKTLGIVLQITSYKDNDVIVKMYTQKFGLLSFIISNVKSPKSKIKPSLLQPLSVLEITFNFVASKGLQRIDEATLHLQIFNIQSSVEKTALLYFMNEILYKSIKEEEANNKLFLFIILKIQELEDAQKIYFFSISFLIELSYYLGFFPNNNYNQKSICFDMIDGVFLDTLPRHTFIVDLYYCKKLASFINDDFEIDTPPAERNWIVNKLIDYYQLHIANFGALKSLKVLNEVFE